MPFSEDILRQAWLKAKGKCECQRISHNHQKVRCSKNLVWNNRGDKGRGCWEAHHRNRYKGDSLSNCEILCSECHKLTKSYGKSLK